MPRREITLLAVAKWPKEYPRPMLPEVAFGGKSNVGKSSLINSLLGKRRIAPISQRPGKTQLIHFYQVRGECVFVDLPGYGYAQVPDALRRSWGPMVETYLSEREVLKLVVLLVDIRRTPSDEDLMFRDWLYSRGLPFITVATKADKVPRSRRISHLEEIASRLEVDPSRILPFSSLTGEGKRDLWKRIKETISWKTDKGV